MNSEAHLPQHGTPSDIDALANQWATTLAHKNPAIAIKLGHEPDGFADYSPEGVASLVAEARQLRAAVEAAAASRLEDRVTKRELERELTQLIREHEAGLLVGDLNVIASPAQEIRNSFDLLPRDTERDWLRVVHQLAAVPQALDGVRRGLTARAASPHPPPQRQVVAVAEQSRRTAQRFAANADDPRVPGPLAAEVRAAALRAADAYERFTAFLVNELSAHASAADGVGEATYRLSLSKFLGAEVDPHDSYDWGLRLLDQLTTQQRELATQLCGEPSVAAAADALNRDPARLIHGTDALRGWLQDTSDAALDALSGTHFDIVGDLRRLDCQIAPAGDGGIYYTEPSLDGARPGTMWWSVPASVDTFRTWRERTTVYHEGVPGHHLQMGGTALNPSLNVWRRSLAGTSGHREGWALYAEDLMHEFGFLDDPADLFGMLDAQKMRAARVVIDIGLHLGLPRPDGGGTWTPEYALQFLGTHTSMHETTLRYEILRYLGWPGQAASYSIGQRMWREAREKATASGVILRDFHRRALALGGLGLNTFAWALDLHAPEAALMSASEIARAEAHDGLTVSSTDPATTQSQSASHLTVPHGVTDTRTEPHQ